TGIHVMKDEASIAARAASALDDTPYFIGAGSGTTAAGRVEARTRSGPLWSTGGPGMITAVTTVDRMQQAVQALDGIPGQRSLLWVTGQVPFNFHRPEPSKNDSGLPPEFLNTMSVLDRQGIDLTLIETYLGSHGSSTSTFEVGRSAPDRYGQAQVLTGS